VLELAGRPASRPLRSSRSRRAVCSATVWCASGYRCSPRTSDWWLASRRFCSAARVSPGTMASQLWSQTPAPPSPSQQEIAFPCSLVLFFIGVPFGGCNDEMRSGSCSRKNAMRLIALTRRRRRALHIFRFHAASVPTACRRRCSRMHTTAGGLDVATSSCTARCQYGHGGHSSSRVI
jgi:hypothetical protein